MLNGNNAMERAPRYASTPGTSTSATAGSVFSPPNGEPGGKGRVFLLIFNLKGVD